MKILEAQSAVLTNYEVYQHLVDIHKRNNTGSKKRRMPEDAFRLSNEVLEYLQTKPYPLHDQKEKQLYSEKSLELLCEKLAGSFPDITKGEGLAIFDVRPTNIAVLTTLVENIDERFTEDEQQQIVNLVIEILGQDEPQEEEEEEEGEEGAEDGDAVQSVETTYGA
ncbi:putative DNA-directed RNA polymerase III subunit [Triangularia verruculosa]|uniref:DNA-directed RNA polymerase III subunit RPC9 n=1 Tax=Triangularia verruculosa TaxID=2587418 RepID=A0AAN7AWV7_9PEZI|nr:putative DNA-directed RNA polymerase III subunit [Triangularia verruculosa]